MKAEVQVENGKVNVVTVDMGEPRLTKSELPMLDGGEEHTINETMAFGEVELTGTAVSMGNPHIVFRSQTLNRHP